MALTIPGAVHRTASVPKLPLLRLSRRWLAAVLAGLFMLLLGDALLHERAAFDLAVLRAVQDVSVPGLDAVLHPVDWLTSGPGSITMWSLLLVAFVLARWWLPTLALLTLPAGGVINHAISELLVGRARPGAAEVERVIGGTEAASFPSGHVQGAVMLYGLLFVIADRIEQRALRLAVKAASISVIALTGFGRLWYGAHWPTDVLGAYALGGLLLVGIVAAYRKIDAVAGSLPFIKAGSVPHDETVPHAHALTSLVLFNGDTVSKVYAPGFLPRAIYWLAFQAEFPYIRNHAALQAALQRRNLAGLLTSYWYGSSRVARALAVEPVASGYALTGAFVDGHAPRDRAAAKAFLRDLRGRFEEAGLPTWQIDPRQPRAVDNVLETADGRYHIVDLESGLVAPIASLKTWARGIRRGAVPLYDDVFFDRTRAYIAREEAGLRESLGAVGFAELLLTLDAAEREALAWHASEPRLVGRLVRAIAHGFYLRQWPSWTRSRLAGSQEKAQTWLLGAVATWEREGRISAAEADAARAGMDTAEFQAMLPHLGAHIVISVPLRFPLGSLARLGWTVGVLGVATARLLTRRIDRRAWAQAWSIHSPLVALLSAVPGFGTFAYLAAKPVRQNRLLLRAAADALSLKVPGRLYERSGVRRLVARPLSSGAAPAARTLPAAVPGLTTIGSVSTRAAGAGRYSERTAAAHEGR